MDQPPKPVLLELDYTTPAASEPMVRLRDEMPFRVAVVCWGLPLALGLAIFLSFEIFHANVLLFLGALDVLFGVILSVAGFLSGILLLIFRCATSERPFREGVLPAIGMMALLASNYFIAYLCALLAHV